MDPESQPEAGRQVQDDSKSMYKLELTIFGRVQGVNFRNFVETRAHEFKLVGWVKNNPDETVSIVAEGEGDVLEKFKEWCAVGPRWARVVKIEEKWIPIAKISFDHFIVIRSV